MCHGAEVTFLVKYNCFKEGNNICIYKYIQYIHIHIYRVKDIEKNIGS